MAVADVVIRRQEHPTAVAVRLQTIADVIRLLIRAVVFRQRMFVIAVATMKQMRVHPQEIATGLFLTPENIIGLQRRIRMKTAVARLTADAN